ncbi:MAG: M23 family metallopeptidase [Rhodobacterales bacterium]|nr:M23 family metallopeptidase [Rhodobacterales bacterium]
MRCLLALVILLALAAPAHAAAPAAPTFDRTPRQGALLVGTTTPGSRVLLGRDNLRTDDAGRFLLALDRDAPAHVALRIVGPDGTEGTFDLAVAPRAWKVERVNGLQPKKVTPDPEHLKRIRAEGALIAQARRRDSAAARVPAAFAWPVTGRISGVFGSQRVLNGQPRSPHRGLDIAAPPGTPVRPMAPGVVSLVHPDMFYTGRTVMVDHGFGLASVYVHMRDIAVTEGQKVDADTVIGTVGQSGRATGPHLHWGVSLFGTLVDPAGLVGPMPQEGQ